MYIGAAIFKTVQGFSISLYIVFVSGYLVLSALTNESDGIHFIYFLINSTKYATVLFPSTAHFFFFIIGASPAAFSKTSTKKYCETNYT